MSISTPSKQSLKKSFRVISAPSTVKVILRIKNEGESDSNGVIIKKQVNGKDHVIINQQAFPVDNALNAESSQVETYNAVIGNGVDLCLTGYHVSAFAYGQTGSGKTFSITGNKNQPGILPQFAANLFEKLSKENLQSCVFVSLSFYEVYQEKVYDLLSSERKALRVRGSSEDAYVEGVIEVGVKNVIELENWRRIGLSRRATAATLMNELSSRSHAIFCLKIQREYQDLNRTVASKCFFVDLAGSERLPSSGDHRLIESTSINKSLLSLQRVVDARASNNGFVCYRDSVLTRLLKNCFDGNSVTTLLATVSPLECYTSETLNTLRFASKAAKISQDATINEEVGGESVSYLRERNEFYLQKIESMGAQIEILKQHCASAEMIQAPAVLELYQDESLNQWTPLEGGVKFSIFSDSFAEYFKDDGWKVIALAVGIFINGVSLNVNEKKKLNHGDIISYYERKFCAIYLDEKCDPNKFITYDRAKLQYVTAVFEKQKAEMAAEIIAESKQSEKAVKESLESELVTLRKEVGALKLKLKDKSNDEKKSEIKKECEMLESMISDTEDVKKNLTAAVFNETEIFKAKKVDTEEDKAMHVTIKSKIELMNSLLNKTGKGKIFDFRFHDLQAVKLFNKKNKVFAELDYEMFIELYDHFADLYQSNKTPEELLAEFNRYLYSNRYVWKPSRSGVGSSLLQTAVFNTLQETARKRRSTYAEVSYGFASRRSVIADIIQKPSDRPTSQPVDEFIKIISSFALTGQRVPDSEEELGKLNETSILINTCAFIRKNFDVFVAPENFMTAASLQKKATAVVGVYRSIGSLDALAAAAQLCYIAPCLADISLDYCPKEMLERINCLRQLIESWITAVREDTLSKDHGQLIFIEIDRIIRSVGYLAYFLGKRVEVNDPVVRKEFMVGVMSAVQELITDVPGILEQCDGEKTSREKFKKLAAKFVTEILKYAVEPYNESFIFEVARRAILIKETMMSLSEDRAGKMVEKINELIYAAEEFSNIIKPETFELLKNGLMMWKQLSYAAAKPPKARAILS